MPYVAGFALLFAYEGLIRLTKLPGGEGASQYQSNVVRMERVVQSAMKQRPVIMVGSSLTANLKPEMIGPGVVGAGLAGGSPQTGLSVVTKMRPTNATILVEVSETILKGVDDKTVEQVTNPLTIAATSKVALLRQEFQPLNLLVSIYRNKRGKADIEAAISPLVAEKAILTKISESKSGFDAEEERALENGFCQVKELIEELEVCGNSVVLFSVPMDSRVMATQRQREFDQLAHSAFPESKYKWLSSIDGNWVTLDGVHLIEQQASEYSRRLGLRLRAFKARATLPPEL